MLITYEIDIFTIAYVRIMKDKTHFFPLKHLDTFT